MFRFLFSFLAPDLCIFLDIQFDFFDLQWDRTMMIFLQKNEILVVYHTVAIYEKFNAFIFFG